jgi:hypothetical protein
MSNRIQDLEILELATDLNEYLEEADGDDSHAPIGRFAVTPMGYNCGITFESWGPSWHEDDDDRPAVNVNDQDSEPIPLREHMLVEMESLGKRILAFVELARQAGAEEDESDAR